MEKKKDLIKIIIGVVATCVLVVVVYVFYSRTTKEFNELKNDINSVNSELVNIHKENDKIINQLNTLKEQVSIPYETEPTE